MTVAIDKTNEGIIVPLNAMRHFKLENGRTVPDGMTISKAGKSVFLTFDELREIAARLPYWEHGDKEFVGEHWINLD